jgi:hypothetical protein
MDLGTAQSDSLPTEIDRAKALQGAVFVASQNWKIKIPHIHTTRRRGLKARNLRGKWLRSGNTLLGQRVPAVNRNTVRLGKHTKTLQATDLLTGRHHEEGKTPTTKTDRGAPENKTLLIQNDDAQIQW